MSQLLIQKQITAAQILRTYGKQFTQITGRYSDNRLGRCVVGILSSYFGWDGQSKDDRSLNYSSQVKELIGNDVSEKELLELNDSGKTFDEIADYLENSRS